MVTQRLRFVVFVVFIGLIWVADPFDWLGSLALESDWSIERCVYYRLVTWSLLIGSWFVKRVSLAVTHLDVC